uniref:Odorant receptor n=1 Tax=Ctenopseustis herana TaxID=65029 RepID=A0A097ITT0_9NEOP|nr:olfactory receptor 1b [Ctenopseustis herana]
MEVFDLGYIKRIRFTLRYLGAWPNHVFEDCVTTKWSAIRRYWYTMLLSAMSGTGMVSQAMYLIGNVGVLGFIDLGQTCLIFLISCVFFQRTTLPLQSTYRENIKDFILTFHLTHHKNKSEFALKMCNRVNRICEIATIVQFGQIYITSFMFNIVPLYINYRSGMLSSDKPANGTYELSIYYAVPFDMNGFWYTVLCIYNCYGSFNVCCMFCFHDLLVCVFVFHIWGHLTIFEHKLNYFPRPRKAVGSKTDPMRYSYEENKEVASGLREIVKQYLMIKEFLANTSATYSVTLCVYYGFHLVSDCILLLECSSLDADALAKYGMVTLVVFQQLIQLPVVFELISSKGDALVDAVYGLPWECMDNSNRRTVLILLQIVQQSLALKACNMVPVGVQTMVAVLKASYSYFMMLNTFAK